MKTTHEDDKTKDTERSMIAAFLLVALLAAPAAAEEKKEADRVFSLGKVEVTGKGEQQQSPVVTTLSEEEMLQFDRKTVAEAASMLPGVSISRVGARNESMVFVRGFDLKHAPIFMDGIPIYVPYDGYPDLGRFFTYDLSQIDVAKGVASVLYGPNTMGGAINLVSKRPEKQFEGNVGTGFRSDTAYHAFANLGTNQKNWYLQAGGSWVDNQSFRLSDDFRPTAAEAGDKRNNSYQKDSKGTIKIGLTPNNTDEYALSYINQQGEKGTPPYTGTNGNPRYWQWPYWDKESLYFNSNTQIGDKSYLKSRLYYDKFQNSLHIFTNGAYSTITPNKGNISWYDDYTIGGSLEAGTGLVAGHLLKMALHYKDDVHREQSDASPQQRYQERIYSIAAEDTIDLGNKLSAILGVSYDSQVAVEAQDYSGTPKTLKNLPTAKTSAVNPQATLAYKVSNTGKAHAAVGMKSRFPSIKDKFSYKFGTYITNPDLEVEKAVNWEVGYQDVMAGALHLKTTGFYSAISDYIQAAVTATPGVSQNQNVGRVNRFGYEIELFAPIGKQFEAGGNYTWIYNDNRTNEQQITDVPKHKIMVYGRYTPVKTISLQVAMEHNSDRYSSSDGRSVAEDFTVFNAKVGYEAVRDLLFEAGVDNILDKNYAVTEGYPETGRSFFLQARYRF